MLAADTVVAVGRRILPKAETMEEARECLRLLSGRSHRVYHRRHLLTPSGAMRRRLVETRLRFKRLSAREIEAYLASAEWRDKAGGYAIQGIAGAFVVKLSGSYSAVVGLPLNETVGAARRRGLSRPFQLAQPVDALGRLAPWPDNVVTLKPTRPARSAASPRAQAFHPFCSARCAGHRPQPLAERRLCHPRQGEPRQTTKARKWTASSGEDDET